MNNSRGDYPRQLQARVRQDMGLHPAVAIMGARQVGKTTLARTLAQEFGLAYRSLDDRQTRDQALEDPEGLIESVADTGAVFDEVQRAPDLLLAMKTVVDREQRRGRFLLTGSNQPQVSQHVADSLVGRVAYRTLRPLTLSEQRFDDSPSKWSTFFELESGRLEQRLTESAESSGALNWETVTAAGGMPRALAVSSDHRLDVLDQYLQTFARRDIREVLAVDSVERLEQFVRLMAARTGTELNLAKLGTILGQSVTTVRRWIDALERSYLVTRLPPFSRNASARVIKAPKVFMADPALAMAGSGELQPTGFHFETLIANDLLVWRDEAVGRGLFHWRIPSGPEVDFVLIQGKRVVAVEVKCADSVNRADGRHLSLFLERHPEGVMGVLLSGDGEIRWVADRILAIPWWAVL